MILDRMIARLQARTVIAALGALTTLLLVGDFLESARRVLAAKTSLADVALFYVYKVPAMLHLALPVALVVGTCVAFAQLGRGLELRALAAAGIGPRRLLVPLLGVALAALTVVVLLGELVVPPATNAFEALMMEHFGRIDSSWRFFPSQGWFRGDGGRLFRVAYRDENGRWLKAVKVFELDDSFRIVRRLDMQRADWRDGRWIGRQVVERRFAEGRLVAYHTAAEQVLDWTEAPERFRRLIGRPQQKNLLELAEAIEGLERQGMSARAYRLAMHNRFAHPLSGLVLVLWIVPWLVRPDRQRTVAGALIESVGLVFVAYVLLGLATSAVAGGLLEPWLGAWLPVAVLLVAAAPQWIAVIARSTSGGER